MDIRLIAVDLDGTLLREDSTLCPRGVKALKAAEDMGIKVVITTTRVPHSAVNFALDIGLRSPVICTNGAEIYASPDGPVWHKADIDLELARDIAALCDARGWRLITTVDSVTYYRQQDGQSLEFIDAHRYVVKDNVDALEFAPQRILSYESDAIPVIMRYLTAQYDGRYHTEVYYNPDESLKSMGIFAPEGDKGKGLSYVMRRLGIPRDAVMAIGDNPNDLPMFACADVRIAMGNAVQAVKEFATDIAPTNDDAGVAWAVQRYIFDNQS